MPAAIADHVKVPITFPECTMVDTTEVLLIKIKELGDKLRFLERGGGERTLDHFGVERGKGYLYSEAHTLTLNFEIAKLIAAINRVQGSDSNWETNNQKQRVLRAAFAAIICPNQANINDLQKVANEVQGHGSTWRRVGIALGAIVVALLSIVVVGLLFTNDLTAEWKKHSRQGLSKATEDVLNSIKKTDAPARLAKNSFFYDKRVGNSTTLEGADSVATEEPTAPPVELT